MIFKRCIRLDLCCMELNLCKVYNKWQQIWVLILNLLIKLKSYFQGYLSFCNSDKKKYVKFTCFFGRINKFKKNSIINQGIPHIQQLILHFMLCAHSMLTGGLAMLPRGLAMLNLIMGLSPFSLSQCAFLFNNFDW